MTAILVSARGDIVPIEAKLRLIGTIWDSMATNPSAIPLTDAQREELDRRLDDLEREGPTGLRADEVLSKLTRALFA